MYSYFEEILRKKYRKEHISIWFSAFVLLAPKDFKLFGFPIFWFVAYLKLVFNRLDIYIFYLYEWVLLNVKWAIVQLNTGENKFSSNLVYFEEMMMMFALYKTKTPSWI